MNSFSGVERALEVEFARQCRRARCAAARSSSRRCSGTRTRGEVRPARIEGGKSRLPLLPGAGSAAARPRARLDRADRSATLPELPAARRDAIRREYTQLGRLRHRRAHRDAAHRRLLRAGRARARRSEDRRELGDGRGARRAQDDGRRRSITSRVRPADLAALLDMVRDGIVSHTRGEADLRARWSQTGDPPAQIAEREGLLKVSDDAALARWIDEVFAENPGEAERFVGGEKKLQGVLVGAVMKKSKGQRRPEARESVAGGAHRHVERRREVAREARASIAGIPKCRSASFAQPLVAALRSASRRTCFASRSASSPDGSSAIRLRRGRTRRRKSMMKSYDVSR